MSTPSVNYVIVGGNLTADPKMGETPNGKTTGRFDLAHTNMGDVNRDKAHFFKVECWGVQAENVGKYVKKGSPVLVEGRLIHDTYMKDGVKIHITKINAFRVHFLNKPQKKEGSAPQPDAPAPSEQDENDIPF